MRYASARLNSGDQDGVSSPPALQLLLNSLLNPYFFRSMTLDLWMKAILDSRGMPALSRPELLKLWQELFGKPAAAGIRRELCDSMFGLSASGTCVRKTDP